MIEEGRKLDAKLGLIIDGYDSFEPSTNGFVKFCEWMVDFEEKISDAGLSIEDMKAMIDSVIADRDEVETALVLSEVKGCKDQDELNLYVRKGLSLHRIHEVTQALFFELIKRKIDSEPAVQALADELFGVGNVADLTHARFLEACGVLPRISMRHVN